MKKLYHFEMKFFTLIFLLLPLPLRAEPAIALGELVAAAAAGASEAEIIQADLINRDAASLRVEAGLAPTLSSKLAFFDSRAETAGGAFAPERTKKTSLTLGVKKMAATGTVIGTELEMNDNAIDYPSFGGAASFTPTGEYKETKFAIFAQQKLLKNAFGSATRAREDAAQARSKATEFDVAARMESYVAGVIEQFYAVWLMQTNYAAARDRLQRTERLLQVTKVKLQRGTAEKSDLLQLESNQAEINLQLTEIRKKLADIWRALIISFNLPETYMQVDVTRVRLIREDRVAQSHSFCKANSYPDSNAVKALQQNLAAVDLENSALSSETRPDLFFEARLASNGIDQDFGEPTADAIGYKNPQASFAIGVDWPIGFVAEKAALLDNFKMNHQLKATLAKLQSGSRVSWINACAEIQRLSEKLQTSEKILSWQRQRLQLEENRFELGQVDLFNVIQSGNDVTTAEVNVKTAQADLDLSAWNILQLHGDLPGYVATAMKNVKRR